MAKEGSTIGGLMDAFGTSVSMSLQYGVPLEDYVRKFSHMRFEPQGHTDDFKEAVDALVAKKIEGGDVTEAPDEDDDADSGEVVDLLAALQRSVDRAKKSRGEGGDDGEDEEASSSAAAKSPAKKAPAKKAPAKKLSLIHI